MQCRPRGTCKQCGTCGALDSTRGYEGEDVVEFERRPCSHWLRDPSIEKISRVSKKRECQPVVCAQRGGCCTLQACRSAREGRASVTHVLSVGLRHHGGSVEQVPDPLHRHEPSETRVRLCASPTRAHGGRVNEHQARVAMRRKEEKARRG